MICRRVLLLALLLAGCGGGEPTRTRLSIATGGTGGVYYVYGGALARELSARLPDVEATAEVTSASVENLHFVADHSADLAFTLADTAADAVAGRGAFDAPLPIATLAVLYRNATHIVVPSGAPINSVRDLAGLRVSTGSPQSGTEVIAARVMEAAGLDAAAIRRERVGVAESAAALKDGRLDAFFWSGGLPTAAVLELAASPGASIRLLPHAELVPALNARYGTLYERLTVPAGTYPGVPAAEVSAVWNLLVTRADLDEEMAYRVTRTLFESKEALAATHPAARALDPARRGEEPFPVPWHPGALRYHREVRASGPR